MIYNHLPSDFPIWLYEDANAEHKRQPTDKLCEDKTRFILRGRKVLNCGFKTTLLIYYR